MCSQPVKMRLACDKVAQSMHQLPMPDDEPEPAICQWAFRIRRQTEIDFNFGPGRNFDKNESYLIWNIPPNLLRMSSSRKGPYLHMRHRCHRKVQ